MGPLATLIFALAGLGLAAVGFELGAAWPCHAGQLLGWMGIGISAVAVIRQYRETRSFTYDFAESHWTPTADGVVLEIPRSEHKKGRTPASTTVYWLTDSGAYEEATHGVGVTPTGTALRITGTKPASGRVVMK
jgi:hypothetical protein